MMKGGHGPTNQLIGVHSTIHLGHVTTIYSHIQVKHNVFPIVIYTGEDMSIHISTIEGETTDDSYYIIEMNPEASFPIGLDTHGSQHLNINALASKLASIEVARKSEEEVSPSENSPDDPLLGFSSSLRSVSRDSQTITTGRK